jgi:molecular chaperone HscB
MTISKSEPAIPVLANGDADEASCWSCGDMRAAHFCRSCGSVQPPAPTDYFSFFGLPRQLNLDTAMLEREMYALSRRLHPDLYARSTQQEQEWSLEQTSKLNDAFRTLRDPVLRTEYLLRIEGIKLAEQSKQAAEQARSGGARKETVPPDLLEEVFELNMQLEEFRAEPGGSSLRAELLAAKKNFERKLDEIGAELKRCWDDWDALIAQKQAGEAITEEVRHRALDGMVNVLNRRRYVDHLVREISAALQE